MATAFAVGSIFTILAMLWYTKRHSKFLDEGFGHGSETEKNVMSAEGWAESKKGTEDEEGQIRGVTGAVVKIGAAKNV